MKRRQWDAKTKTRIVIEGLQGKPVAELCNAYQISQSQYYQWRDQFLANAYTAPHEDRGRRNCVSCG
jgi:transposase-like protein